MKKLLSLLAITLPLTLFAQTYLQDNTYGKILDRQIVRKLQGLPKDTFAVPVQYQGDPHVAIKNDRIFVYSTADKYWKPYNPGGNGGGVIDSIKTLFVIDTAHFYLTTNLDGIDTLHRRPIPDMATQTWVTQNFLQDVPNTNYFETDLQQSGRRVHDANGYSEYRVNGDTLSYAYNTYRFGGVVAGAADSVYGKDEAGNVVLVPLPTLPDGSAQVNADWEADSGPALILNKPTKLSDFTNDLNFSGADSAIYATRFWAGANFYNNIAATATGFILKRPNGTQDSVDMQATAETGITSLTLNTPNVLFSTPINFTGSSGVWSGTMALKTQAANMFLAGPLTGSATAPTFRRPNVIDISTAAVQGVPYGYNGSLMTTDSLVFNRAIATLSVYGNTTGTIGFNTSNYNAAGTAGLVTSNNLVNTATFQMVGSQYSDLRMQNRALITSKSGFSFFPYNVAGVNPPSYADYRFYRGLTGPANGVSSGQPMVTFKMNGHVVIGDTVEVEPNNPLAILQVHKIIADSIVYGAGTLGSGGGGGGGGSYTDANARAAISLTTTGTSGAATYNSSTGVLNIPQYSGGSGGTTYTFSNSSIVNTAGNLALKNDAATPGANKFYGTDASGVPGYQTGETFDRTGLVDGMYARYNATTGKFYGSTVTGTSQWTTNGTAIYYNTGNIGLGQTTPGATIDMLMPAGGGNPSLRFGDADITTIPSYSTVGLNPAVATNTEGSVSSASNTNGGLSFNGFTAPTATAIPLIFTGYHGSTAPTGAAIIFRAAKHNGGTNAQLLANTEAIASFRNWTNADAVKVLGNGDITSTGKVTATAINMTTTLTPTSSADATGATGDIRYDDNFIYIKTSTGWKRSALTTF